MKNLQKTLETLLLPDEFGIYDGIITNKVSKKIYLTKTIDYTKPVIVNKRLVSTNTKSEEWNIGSQITIGSDLYALNKLRFYLDGKTIRNLDPNNTIFSREKEFKTLTNGPFAGQTYWYHGSTVIIKPQGDTYEVTTISDLGNNTTSTGLPEPTLGVNPMIDILVINKIITKTKTTTSSPINVKVDLNTVLRGLNVDYETLKYEMATVETIVKKDDNMYILNTSIEGIFNQLDQNTLTLNAKVYYNGLDTEVNSPNGLLTSYNKLYPGHVVRYRLYDELVTETIYGSSATIQFDALANDEIKIVKGTIPSYNPNTKTLTYNPENGATLWVTFEEKPAQGKNWGNEAIYFLTGTDEILRIS